METDYNWIALTVTYLVLLIGLVSTLLPVLPGCFIIWGGVLIYWLWVPNGGVGWSFVLISAGLAILAQVLDFLAGYLGARRYGATWKGGVGALIGAIVGPMLGSVIPGPGTIIGLIIGPIVGAFLGEMAAGRTIREGGRAGFGTIVGGIVAFALKFVIAIIMVAWFTVRVFF